MKGGISSFNLGNFNCWRSSLINGDREITFKVSTVHIINVRVSYSFRGSNFVEIGNCPIFITGNGKNCAYFIEFGHKKGK